MELKNLEKGTIILAENYQHDSLFQQLLTQENSTGLTGVTVQSLSVFLQQQISFPINKEESFLQIYQAIQALEDQLDILKPFVHSTAFIEEIIDFHNQLTFYAISMDSLPLDSVKEKELYLILNTIKTVKTPEIQRFEILKKLDNYLIQPIYRTKTFISDLYLASYLDQYEENIPLIQQVDIPPSSVEFYKANNPRIEIEGIAQLIIQKNLLAEETMIVLQDDSYSPLLQQVLTRYQIPFQLQNPYQGSIVVQKFLAIFSYCLNPSTTSFIRLIKTECFPIEAHQELLEFVSHHILSPKEFIYHFPHYKEEEYQSFNYNQRIKLESLTQVITDLHSTISNILIEIDSIPKGDVLGYLNYSYQLLLQNSILQSEEEQQCFLQMKAILERNGLSLANLNDVELVLTHLLSSIKQPLPKNSNGLLIVDAQHFFIPNKKTVLLVGCSSDNFPKIIQKEGIIDERYLAKTNFPKKEVRFSFYQEQLEQLFYLAPQLIVSYSYGDYLGKSKDVAFEIEEKMKAFGITQATAIPLVEKDKRIYPNHSISKESAQQLFFINNKLKGSVSSFEKFFQCPYHYYLEYGLGLKESSLPEFSVALLGTILHASLEKMIKRFGKEYPNCSNEIIQSIVEEESLPLIELFPKQKQYIQIAIDKMILQLSQSFLYLAKMEQETTFIPYQMEYKFEKELPLDNKSILLKGIIDRIDTNEQHFRIIDYKSSNHTLSETRMRAGLQLQLPTYLWIMSILLDKKPMGMYYFSFPYNTMNVLAYKLSYRPKQLYEYIQTDWEKEFITSMKLSGWTFDNPELLDFYGENISSLKYKDSKSYVFGREYDFDSLVIILEEIYLSLWNNLSEGVIDCEPTDDACLFCPFQRICQWNGYPRVPKPLSEHPLKKERD